MSDDQQPSTEKLYELLDEAYFLDPSPQKVALLEQAVRLADTLQNEAQSYDIRMDLIQAATFGGQPDRAIVAFSWCLAAYDRNPENYDWFDLYWKYKWIVGNGINYPSLSRSKLEALLDDQAKRYRSMGRGKQASLKSRMCFYQGIGEIKKARKMLDNVDRTRTDELSDCPACTLNNKVLLLIDTGEYDAALQTAEPILLGRKKCAEVPHCTIPTLLLPLLFTGKHEQAADLHERNLRRIRRKSQFLKELGEHAFYLAFRGQPQEALQIIEREFAFSLGVTHPRANFFFYLAALFVLQRLQRSGVNSVSLRLPKDFPLRRDDHTYEVETLIQWLKNTCTTIADDFDQRNGNRYHQRLLKGLTRWHRQADAFQQTIDTQKAKPKAKEASVKRSRKPRK